jgi:hypothetical protein
VGLAVPPAGPNYFRLNRSTSRERYQLNNQAAYRPSQRLALSPHAEACASCDWSFAGKSSTGCCSGELDKVG